MEETGSIAPVGTAEPFHLLAKPTGSACNLACDYCFFLGKSALYPHERQRMSEEDLDTYVRGLFAAHPDGEVSVAFQGGEPTLMGLDFFRAAVTAAERHRGPRQTPVYSIQTNATLVDEEWATFFSDNGFLVGVSIDGPADVHDVFRHDASGRGTLESVVRAIRCLDDAHVDWNALTTVNRASEGRGAEIYEFLRDEAGARYIQLIPIVERPVDDMATPVGAGVTDRSISASGYGAFLKDVFDVWVRRDVGEVYVQDFDVALAAWAGAGNPLCVHAPTCGRALALEFNGDVYSCDHFVDPEHRLGSLAQHSLSELVESEAQRAFGLAKRETMPHKCLDCPVAFACQGGCPKDRFMPTEEGPDANYLCDGYLAFYRHVHEPMSVMARLLAAERAPAEIMELVAQGDRARAEAFAGAGRNDACPCGSGRKFKHCHGAA